MHVAPRVGKSLALDPGQMTGNSLRPSARLTSAHQYDAVFARPKRQSDRLFTILSRTNDKPYGRLGLAVSKRVDKKAVGRNRIKRQIRESFRYSQEQLKGLDLVVIARAGAKQAGNDALSCALARLWQAVVKRQQQPQPQSQRQ
jgi:ribonuclease P protein component